MPKSPGPCFIASFTSVWCAREHNDCQGRCHARYWVQIGFTLRLEWASTARDTRVHENQSAWSTSRELRTQCLDQGRLNTWLRPLRIRRAERCRVRPEHELTASATNICCVTTEAISRMLRYTLSYARYALAALFTVS